MKRFADDWIPAEKPWSTAVDPRRAGAAMAQILIVTICAKALPGSLSPTVRLAAVAALEVSGCAAALFLVLFPERGAGRRGILGAEPFARGSFPLIAAAPFLIWGGCAALGLAWGGILTMLEIPYEEHQPLIENIRNFAAGDFLLVLAAVGVMTPAAEEFFFRRLLYGVLEEPLGARRAALATSALFAAAHGFLFGLPGLFWMGLVFQVLYCRCRNLGAPILVHAVVNCVALVAARAGMGMGA